MERRKWQNIGQLEKRKNELKDEVQKLQEGRIENLQTQLAIRILEIGEEGGLFYYDPLRPKDRRIEITAKNVGEFIAAQRRQAGGRDVFFLLMYPRPLTGVPARPFVGDRDEYDRWFRGVAHGYDVR
jgi:hypothetical protein